MTDTPDSPCIRICTLDKSGTYCTGCLRTRHEIAVWSTADTVTKRTILNRIEKRGKDMPARHE